MKDIRRARAEASEARGNLRQIKHVVEMMTLEMRSVYNHVVEVDVNLTNLGNNTQSVRNDLRDSRRENAVNSREVEKLRTALELLMTRIDQMQLQQQEQSRLSDECSAPIRPGTGIAGTGLVWWQYKSADAKIWQYLRSAI